MLCFMVLGLCSHISLCLGQLFLLYLETKNQRERGRTENLGGLHGESGMLPAPRRMSISTSGGAKMCPRQREVWTQRPRVRKQHTLGKPKVSMVLLLFICKFVNLILFSPVIMFYLWIYFVFHDSLEASWNKTQDVCYFVLDPSSAT